MNLKKWFLGLGFVSILYPCQAQFVTNNGLVVTNSTLVSTNGDWSNDASASIINDGIIRSTESFVNNGSIGNSTGGFELNYASDLNFKSGNGSFGFLNKQGAGNIAITGSLTVKDSLLLKGGKIILGSSDTLSLGGRALVVTAANSYVDGKVSHTGTGDKLFPLGKNGNALPIKIYKAQVQKITASVLNAPTDYSAGPGVNSLIGFPYVWRIDKKSASDTSAYVELRFPSALKDPVTEPIVARQIPGNRYKGMGQRFTQKSNGFTEIRSYSRGLKGTFTVVSGIANDPVTDSLALTALYNSTGGTSWTNKTNWTTGQVSSWFGIDRTAGKVITSITLPNNNLRGPVPDQLSDILGLETVNLSSNQITFLPALKNSTGNNLSMKSLNVSNNKLTFESLEPNAGITTYSYSNQAKLGKVIDSLVAVNSPYKLSYNVGGTSTVYTWKRNGTVVPSATSAIIDYAGLNRSNMGLYVLEATNTKVPGLTLTSENHKVQATATISGQLFVAANSPANNGEMTLYRVKPGAFEPVQTVDVSNTGTYNFQKVILDDYQLVGFADTLTHTRALPTYYKNTIYWEEADTLFVEGNINALNITSQFKPGPPTGVGRIDGYLQEDDGTGRGSETQKPKRVGGAGASVRRVESTGRPQAEKLTLVAYVFTDEDGEFTLPNLPEGLYRINIQYPGYPMDESSDINITIGSALKSQAKVAANVLNGKINVKKLIITDIDQVHDHKISIYPNPAVDYIKLIFAEPHDYRRITLSNINGVHLINKSAFNKEEVIQLKGLVRGVYLVKVMEGEKTVKISKIVIE